MKTFGKHLREQRVLTSSQLEEALRSQVVSGGRLGTNLVELKLLTPEELSRHLSRYTGFPPAPMDLLAHPERQALRAVPIELARRFKLLALKLDSQGLHVAMLDPQDTRQTGELARVTGQRLRPYVTCETELLHALERHLGIRRDPRFVRPTGDAGGDELLLSEVDDSDPAQGPDARVLEMESRGFRPLDRGEELLDAESFSNLQGELVLAREAAENGNAIPACGDDPEDRASEPTPAAPPATVAEVMALEHGIAEALDRDRVFALAVRMARAYVPAVALFVVHRGMIMGLYGEGTEGSLEGIVIPVHAASIFARPVHTGSPYRGEPPGFGLDARILRALGRDGAKEAVVMPLAIRERIVNVLYADNGSDPLSRTAMAGLEAVADCVSSAYERIICYRKSLIE